MEKNKWVKVCPFCKSEYFAADRSNMGGAGPLKEFVCYKCNRSFTVALEISKQSKSKDEEESGFV